jgi:hypothetical protein
MRCAASIGPDRTSKVAVRLLRNDEPPRRRDSNRREWRRPGRWDRLCANRAPFKELFAAKDRNEPLLEALERVARDTLGPYGETRAARNVVEGLARSFDAEHGTRVVEDPMVVGRLLEVYLVACQDIAQNGATTLDLPFIAATTDGPLNFERRVTAAELAALASGTAPPAEKKRGFFARLFGS